MTDEEFAEFCEENPDYFIEMTADGEILIKPPNYTLTSIQSVEIAGQLAEWNDMQRTGIVTNKISGFVLPNGARRSAGVSWIARSSLNKLDPAAILKYWHLCPDFVIELRSQTDRLPTLRAKMREWMANGAQLAWLIDPDRRAVEVYRPDCDPEIIDNATAVTGEGPVEGFVLHLAPVWDPLQRVG
jgi:Uma2 family endonuclease